MTVRSVAAQEVSQDTAELRTADELQGLVGPIALYPDDLVAIVLPATTYPLQIVEAARFLEQRKVDGALQPDEDWDDSIVALLNYPEVVKLLNDDLDWTWDLGQAVLSQNAEVLGAIQTFRDRAYAAGNLKSDDRQVVTAANEAITIAPADPEVIYVPYYEPERVVVYQPRPVYYYYPIAYPVYYYPYPIGYHFHTGFFWGVSTAFVIGWHTHHVHVYPYGFHGHPYYGHHYYDNYYVRNNVNIRVNVVNYNGSQVWQPRHRNYGGRPFTRSDGHYVSDRQGNSASRGQAATRAPAGGTTRAAGGRLGGATPRDQAASNYRGSTQAGSANANAQNGAARTTQRPSGAASSGSERPTQQPPRTTTYRSSGNLGGAAGGTPRATTRTAPTLTPRSTAQPSRTTEASRAPAPNAGQTRTYRSGSDPRLQRSSERAPSAARSTGSVAPPSATRSPGAAQPAPRAASPGAAQPAPRAASPGAAQPPPRSNAQAPARGSNGGEARSSQGSGRSQQNYRGNGRGQGR